MDLTTLEQFGTNIRAQVGTVDWTALGGALGSLAEQALKPLIDGTALDLKTEGQAIAGDMLLAVMRGDIGWRNQLTDQIKVLAEKARIRGNKADWTFAEQALGFVFHAVLAGVGAAVPKP